MHGCGTLGQILERILIHVDALRQFQLDRIDARVGRTVVSGLVAALEAAVDDVRVLLLRAQQRTQALLQGRRATRATGSAEIGIKQAPFEQEGADRAGGVDSGRGVHRGLRC